MYMENMYFFLSICETLGIVYKDPFVPLMNAYTCILTHKVKLGFSLISEREFNCTNETESFFNGHTYKSSFI